MGIVRVTLCVAGALLVAAVGARPDQSAPRSAADPVGLTRAWFEASDAAVRRGVVARLVAHPDYRPSRVSGWLHRAAPFPDIRPGIDVMRVDVGGGDLGRSSCAFPTATGPTGPGRSSTPCTRPVGTAPGGPSASRDCCV